MAYTFILRSTGNVLTTGAETDPQRVMRSSVSFVAIDATGHSNSAPHDQKSSTDLSCTYRHVRKSHNLMPSDTALVINRS